MPVSASAVLSALEHVVEPARSKDVVRLDMVRDLKVSDEEISFSMIVRDPASDFARTVSETAERAIREHLSTDVSIKITIDNEMIGIGETVSTRGAQSTVETGVTNLIAVASGKGGVGKSTVAANLAVALAKQGFDVGLVDTDIYGPSIPTMFGATDAKPRVNEERKIEPIERHGVRLLSMGFLVDLDKAVIWRGPMVSSAVRQFLGDAEWGELDYLVLDLPPGTGDIQLTLVQSVALTGSVIVSTPQTVALADARKGVAMFNNVNVPVLGIVENMSYFVPPDAPGKKYHIFGEGGARRLSDELSVPFLGEIPLEQSTRESGDAGTPIVEAVPDSLSSRAFFSIATSVKEQVALRNACRPASQKVEILYR
ncbi:MAG: P-loop NTPase [Bacteroidota bacterium]